MKTLVTVLAVAFLTGCAASAGEMYYNAMGEAARANAQAQAARYDALAKLAQSGDPGAATAATMAIALSREETVVPQYVESQALKWASVLANPLATVGGLAINASVAKNQSNNNRDVQMANITADQTVQLGNQAMVSGITSTNAASASAATTALVSLGTAGFTALNTAGDQTVTTAQAGLTSTQAVATAGLTSTQAVATAGITATQTVGIAAIDGLNGMSTNYNDLLGDINTTNAGTLTSMQTNYQAIISDLNTTINNIAEPDPVTP